MSDHASETLPAAPTGAYHPDLTAAFVGRYREPRIDASELVSELTCSLSGKARNAASYPVVNVSSTGVAVSADQVLEPEMVFTELTLRYAGRVVFVGPARVAHKQAGERGDVFGLQFCESRLDAGGLLREAALAAQLRSRLALADQQMQRLPVAWRAAVADLRQLLDGIERTLNQDGQNGLKSHASRDELELAGDGPGELRLFEAAFAAWGPRLHELLSELHRLSADFDENSRASGRDYAYRMLWPALRSCPMHRRAHDKPRGYAGDYRMMLLYFARQYEGRTRYARFLQHAAQRYSLGQAVVERQQCLRAALRGATKGERPRIVSLASGPALELAAAIAAGELQGPLDLVLIDQDEEALAYAHAQLSELIRRHGRDIDLLCINMSVKQLLSPKGELERSLIQRHVAQASLIYCCGLYDYLPDAVAERLTLELYRLLAPGGRLYLGNLVEAPDTSWIMDYVLDWKLIYRTDQDMVRLARQLAPSAVELAVEHDRSGHAIFLSARAPG